MYGTNSVSSSHLSRKGTITASVCRGRGGEVGGDLGRVVAGSDGVVTGASVKAWGHLQGVGG